MDNGGAFTALLIQDAGIGTGQRVLDIGCGPGDVSLRVAKMVGPQGSVVGLDRDASMLHRARERARTAGLGNITFVAGDLSAGPLPPGPFDAVIGRRVLMYVADPAKVVRSLVGLIRSGGVIALQEHDSARLGEAPLPPHHGRLHEALWRTIEHEGGNVHMGFAMAPVFRAAGLVVAGLRVEATLLLPEIVDQITTIGRHMVPRMIAAGAIGPGEIDADDLGIALATECAASSEPLAWESIFGIWARID